MKKKVWIPGHTGLLGNALVDHLKRDFPEVTLLTATHAELDLTDQAAVRALLEKNHS